MHLLRSGSEVGLQAKDLIGGADHAVEPRLVHPHVREKELLVVLGHVGDLRLERGADRYHRGIFFLCVCFDLLQLTPRALLGHVGDVYRRLHGEQKERLEDRMLLLREVRRARRASGIEDYTHFAQG
ncbi:MAG: hypothetical protein AUG50_02105 [Betaproteobacteria bacterium 13_1_20CM_3_63_8]|nr:MAG: hypothetical protein AUG50_02105 [Betaproteobacteria bacterium 13_1_20CM_3_63_8]